MKSIFRVIVAFLGLVLLNLSVFPAEGEDYRFMTNNGTITILQYTGAGGSVTIPSTVGNLPVTQIGGWAFYQNKSVTSLTIPKSVTTIEQNAFAGCTSLTNVLIPASVTSIGYAVFNGCTGLASVIIPSGVTSIDGYALSGCTGLTSVWIPNSVTNIGLKAFSGCTSLTVITVDGSNSAYSSANGVLFNKSQTGLIQCPSAKAGAYTIPNSVQWFELGAFQFCSRLTRVTIPNSVKYIGSSAFFGCTGLTSVTIPNSVTSIDEAAFYGCIGLTSVIVPDSVVIIRPGAFSNCTSLKDVRLGKNLDAFGWDAFSGCTNLAAIEVDPLNTTYSSVDGVVFDKTQTTLLQCPLGKAGSYTIPSGVTILDLPGFQDCARLTSVTIPDSVTRVPEYGFSGCTNLSSVFIGSGVTVIYEPTFDDCPSLTNIIVDPRNRAYSSVDDVLFNKDQTTLVLCPDGKEGSYTIPRSTTRIENLAFYGCANLTAINVDALNTAFSSSDGVLFDKSQTKLIQYPRHKAGAYIVPNTVTNIRDQTFHGCTSLTSVTMPNSVAELGLATFAGCTSLTEVAISQSVTNIGWGTFLGCTCLASVNLPNCVTYIGENAFAGCSSLPSVTIPKSVTTIANSAFDGCTRLAGIYFPGDAPQIWGEFSNLDATVYYLPGSKNWGSTFGGRPTALWQPRVQIGESTFGVRTNHFGFGITWADDTVVIIEASPELIHPNWLPVATNTLFGDSSYFSDPQWRDYSRRFYRLRAP